MQDSFYEEIVSSSGTFKYYIDGQWKESKSGKSQAITNPSTLQPEFTVQGKC